MNNSAFKSTPNLNELGIINAKIQYQLSAEQLHQLTLDLGQGVESSSGALVINTGKFSGRSPKDRFIVKDAITEKEVWWGEVNIPFAHKHFEALYNKVTAYLSNKEIYVRDTNVCSEPKYRLNVRVVTETPWANLFCHNMFLRLKEEELEGFRSDWTVICVPSFLADPAVDKTRQGNFAILNFTRRIVMIGGTGYTGEIKKGIFSALNFLLPVNENILSMHCSANVGENEETAVFFGLSGTGKTTLSADPKRKLIGDDEHGWTKENTVFNFEGGCYAKVVNLSEENEPDIFRAVRKGALLENVVFKVGTNEIDYSDISVSPNTRVSYPIEHIDNVQPGCVGSNPKNIFFLTADSFGILPPIARLTPGQAAYHFISGYTAKIAGTEAGITEPQPNFSACFGAPFMPLHPTRYAEMLSQKIKEDDATVWLINTGWTGGPYGIGNRMKLKFTRAMIDAALSGDLNQVDYNNHAVFGIAIPQSCPNVPSEILNPRDTWADATLYDVKAVELGQKFQANFVTFANYANEEILAGAPKV